MVYTTFQRSAAADNRLIVFSFWACSTFIEANVLFPSADVSTITIALSSFGNRQRRIQNVACQREHNDQLFRSIRKTLTVTSVLFKIIYSIECLEHFHTANEVLEFRSVGY